MTKKLKYAVVFDHHYENKEKKEKLDRVRNLIKDQLSETLTLVDAPEDADIILVAGGDGFMFRTIRKYHHLNKPFFGINAGTVGFLYNQPEDIDKLPQTMDELTTYEVPIIPVSITYKDGTSKTGFFVNDIQIGRLVKSSCTFSLSGTKDRQGNPWKGNVRGTMLLVNTPLGSTGYGAGLQQPLLPRSDDIRGIAGMGTGAFKNQSIEPQTLHIDVNSRHQIDAYLDGEADEHHNIASVTVYPSTKKAHLAFLEKTDFIKRRYIAAEDQLKKQEQYLFNPN